jgi:hypothetical protein
MSSMDHAAAHERIADLLLEPARLTALDATAPEDVALREHLATCGDCRADLETSRRLAGAVGNALPRDAGAARGAVEPVDAPPSLRARVIAAVHDAAQDEAKRQPAAGTSQETAPHDRPISIAARRASATRRRARRAAPWLGLAASIAVVLGASWITLDQVAHRARAESQSASLTSIVAAMDRVLETDHRIVALENRDGVGAGSISWSSHDWVVLTTALAEPPADQRYKCWLVEADGSVLVGQMAFAGATAYWVGSLDEWATWEIGPETQFVVTLEPSEGRVVTGEPVLSADLSS